MRRETMARVIYLYGGGGSMEIQMHFIALAGSYTRCIVHPDQRGRTLHGDSGRWIPPALGLVAGRLLL